MTKRDPRRDLLSHPGEILKNDFLEPMGLSVSALSNAMNVPRTRMNDIVLKRRSITADTALRLGRVLNTSPEYWINLQTHYDLVMAETEPDNEIDLLQPIMWSGQGVSTAAYLQ